VSSITPTRSYLATVNGVRLFVREWGPADAEDAVLFLHGAECHTGASIGEVARSLATSGIRTIAPDAPGFGRSPASPVTGDPPATAELLGALAARCARGAVVLAGHSWGAHVVCWAVAKPSNSWRGALLIDGGYVDFADIFSRVLGMTSEVALEHLHASHANACFPSWEDYFSHLRSGLRRWGAAQMEMYRTAAHQEGDGQVRPIVSASTSADLARSLVERPTSNSWAAMDQGAIPVHLMLSTEPPARASALREEFISSFREALPHAQVQRVPAATHEVIDDAPEAVVGAVLGLLGRTTAAD
jgi:pimeloyl-ACP methyl ester carboxylesterase